MTSILVIDLIIKLGEPLMSGFRGSNLKDTIKGRIIKGIHAKITFLVPPRDGDQGEGVRGSNTLIKSKKKLERDYGAGIEYRSLEEYLSVREFCLWQWNDIIILTISFSGDRIEGRQQGRGRKVTNSQS
jgi:hypothetical protein